MNTKTHSLTTETWNNQGAILFFITIVVASCSIVYELLLAQSLATTMGNTVLRYNLTIGIYIASLGTGAIFYDRLFKGLLEKNLIKVELALAAIGGFAPIVVLFNDFFFQILSENEVIAYSSWFSQTCIFLINHGLIVLVGIISGFELPLLMDLGKQLGSKGNTRVLGFDYVGTMIGAIVFPVFLLPNFGIFSIGYFVGFINIMVAIYLLLKFNVKDKILRYVSGSIFALFTILILFSRIVNEFLISTFYLMEK
jgi:spermidine synthase